MRAELELDISDLNHISDYAKAILDFAQDTRIFLFDAPMGAGKTTLIKEICIQLGSGDHFSSPSYSIINEYDSPAGRIYHFDLYRLKSQEELLDLGIDEHLALGAYCFFEWPEMAEDLIGSGYLKIQISLNENNRYLHASHI